MTPEIIGHRGARALFPENTIAGFQAAWAAGFDKFEIDVGLTQDGIAVLSHDPRLSSELARDASGKWLRSTGPALHDLTFAQLQAFDVGRIRPGSRTARRFPLQRPVDGATIPRLDDVLRLPGAISWTIEIKTAPNRPRITASPEAIADAVAEAADLAGAADRIIVQSFDWRGPAYLRRTRPDLAYAWLTSPTSRAWRGGQARLPDSVVEQGGGTWAPHHAGLTQRLLDRAHRAGLLVVPWTVNDPDSIARLARWGVDGIITDDPMMARAVLQAGAFEPLPHPAPS